MLSSELAWFERQFERLANPRRESNHRHHNDEVSDFHTYRELIMKNLPEFIAAGEKLMSERDALKTDRDAEKARADKAEADRDALQAQITADEASVADAMKAMDAEVDAEAPVTSTVTVAAPTTAPAGVITVTGDVPPIGSTIAGPGITTGASVQDAVPGPVAGQATITLDSATTSDHTGDGTETLTITPPAS